jgi:alpha-L-fucosidase
VRLGEGKDGKLNVLPGGKLGQKQAQAVFGPEDVRFTLGRDGSLYAFTMTVPAGGTELRIHSLGRKAGLLGKPVSAVRLLGYGGTLRWRQEDEALVIDCPPDMPFAAALAFNVR